MKKIMALVMALCIILALCACGAKPPAKGADSEGVPDTMTSADGKYEIGFIPDIGQLKDHSFNEGTWNGVKGYAAAEGISYKCYQPANGKDASDEDRFDAMSAACEAGAKAVVCVGALQEAALLKAAEAYPDVKFVFIDGRVSGCGNIASVAFKEQESGFFAGYAAVMEGYTKLGYTGGGGGENEACCKYGYGFVQGANAAAEEKGVNVEMNYSWEYGGSFAPSVELESMASEWYKNGTECIFCCGGSMFVSVFSAAAANDRFTIGVDSDQADDSETVITSALKGVGEAAVWAVKKAFGGSFGDIGGKISTLGAADGATGLPVNSWRFKKFTTNQYTELVAKVISGEIAVDDDYGSLIQQYSNLKLNIVG